MKRINGMHKWVLIGVMTGAVLTGCGIKPTHLEPPPGNQASGFPAPYPKN